MKKHVFIFLSFLTIVKYCFSQINNNDSATIALNRNYIEAQTKNQQAQTEYYKRQSNPTSTILNGLVPVLGTILVALIGYLSLLAQSNRSLKNELKKIELAKEDEQQKNSKIYAAVLMKKTAVAMYNLCLIYWTAKYDRTAFNERLMRIHDNEMKVHYSEIASAQVMLSGYNKSFFDQTKDIVTKVNQYDGVLGELFVEYKEGNSEAIKDIGNLWREVYNCCLDIPGQFASILQLGISTKPATNKSINADGAGH